MGLPDPQKSALLTGRSSTTMSGLFVLPGVIDLDSVGEIQIMVWTPFPPCTVPKETCVAQLIPLPQTPALAKGDYPQRLGGFASTGIPEILWVQAISDKRPTDKCTLRLQGRHVMLTGVLDTGADVTVIS